MPKEYSPSQLPKDLEEAENIWYGENIKEHIETQNNIDSAEEDTFSRIENLDEHLQSLSEEKIAQEKVKSYIINLFSDKDRRDSPLAYEQIKEVSDEIISDHKIQKAAKHAIVDIFNHGGGTSGVRAIKKIFNISDDFMSSHEVQEAIKINLADKCFRGYWEHSYVDNIIKNVEMDVPVTTQQEAAKCAIIDILLKQRPDLWGWVTKVKDSYNISDDFMSSHEVQEAAKKTLIRSDYMFQHIAVNIKHYFKLPEYMVMDKEVQQMATNYIKSSILAMSPIDNFADIQKEFYIPVSKIQEITALAVVETIQKEDINRAILIRDAYPFSSEFALQNLIVSQAWKYVPDLLKVFPEIETKWLEYLNQTKKSALNQSLPFTERQKNISLLAYLAENGETTITNEFADILKLRGKNNESVDAKWGLTAEQEVAFYTLMRLDTPLVNNRLFGLLTNESIPVTVKYAIMRRLSKANRNFMNEEERGWMKDYLNTKGAKNIDWEDMKFLQAIMDIPSTELKEGSVNLGAYRLFQIQPREEKDTLSQTQQEKYFNIPDNTFLQIELLDISFSKKYDFKAKINGLYQKINKDSTLKSNILYGIVNLLHCESNTIQLFIDKLENIPLETKENAEALNQSLRKVVFLDNLKKLLANSSSYEDDDYGDYHNDNEDYDEYKDGTTPTQFQYKEAIKELFDKDVSNLGELEELLNEAVTARFQEILPHPDITAEKIEKVTEQWSDLEPVFTYLRRFPGSKQYIAEMVAHMDSLEDWQGWRYDLDNKTVKRQVGNLTPEQLDAWKTNIVAEVGQFEIQEGEVSKPEQIRQLLLDAIVRDSHLSNEQATDVKFPLSQQYLENTYKVLLDNPEQSDKAIAKTIEELKSMSSSLNTVILANNSEKISVLLNDMLGEGKNITLNSKTENSLKTLKPYMESETYEELTKKYKGFMELEQKEIQIQELIPQTLRNQLQAKIRVTRQEATEINNSDIWSKIGVNQDQSNNLGMIYQKRAELQAIQHLLRLSNLDTRQVVLNLLTEGKKKSEGLPITGALADIKKAYKGSGFLQDIVNVEYLIKEQVAHTGSRRLAMVFSDNPSFLWQAGKYPIGNGSCQHYAEGSMAESLMGYVGDAHSKVAYLFDINSLSESVREHIDKANSLQEGISELKPNELLKAVVARSIIKLTKDSDNKPAIFMEPVYSVINKSDHSMDRYYNLFMDTFVASPMGAKLTQGSGSEILAIPASRNPRGQYEDGAEGNAGHAGLGIQTGSYTLGAKVINKNHKNSKEENEIIERMRVSVG